ncbi:MAG: hypothetical protein WC732_09105 [Candidatus Omnitrophota bacterium]
MKRDTTDDPETVEPPRARPRGEQDEMNCVICAQPPRSAVTCSRGHLYCKACLIRCHSMPGAARPLSGEPRMDAGATGYCQMCRCECTFVLCPLADRAVRDKPVECSNVGCTATGLTVSTVDQHEETCPYRGVVCDHRQDGCPWQGKLRDMPQHHKECAVRERVRLRDTYRRRLEAHEKIAVSSLESVIAKSDAVCAAVRGVLPSGLISLPGAFVDVPDIDAMPTFRVGERCFSLRAEPLRDDARSDPVPWGQYTHPLVETLPTAKFRQMYGCCIHQQPERSIDRVDLSVHFAVIVLNAARDKAIAVGNAVGTLRANKPSAVAVSFTLPLKKTPPWTVYIGAIHVLPADITRK